MSKIFKLTSFFIVFFFIFGNYSNATNVLIEADKQNYELSSNTASLNGNVKVNYGNIKIKSPKATLISNASGQPQKAIFTNGVLAEKVDKVSNDSITADSMTLLLASNQMIAEGNTYSQIKKNSPASITVRAARQEFVTTSNEMKASGNVQINYKGMSISGGNATILTSAGKPYRATISGGARIVKGPSTISAGTISIDLGSHNLIASGGVTTTTSMQGTGSVSMSSDTQTFDKGSNTIIGSGHVRIVYKDYIASGPKATLFTSGNDLQKIVLTGRGQIKESARQVSADVITISINPKNFVAEGNVKTQFVKPESQQTQPAQNTSKKRSHDKSANTKPTPTPTPVIIDEPETPSNQPKTNDVFEDL